MMHIIKIKAEYFAEVISGQKQFEVRENDRNFKIGDAIALNETFDNGDETGRCTLAEITYILRNDTDEPLYGLMPGFAVLGIMPLKIDYSDIWDIYESNGLTRFDGGCSNDDTDD